MKLFVYTLRETLFEGEVEQATLPAVQGRMTVLPEHEPLVVTLASGAVVSRDKEGSEHEFSIESGLAQIDQENVIALVQ